MNQKLVMYEKRKRDGTVDMSGLESGGLKNCVGSSPTACIHIKAKK